MNYKALSQQYFDQYISLSLYIKKLKDLQKKSDTDCNNLLSRRISILYKICLDLKHISEYLKNCERRENNVENQITIE